MRFLYVGQGDVQWDNFSGLGLYYMHARHYSPALGRFLQPDPAAEEKSLYAYTAGNPISITNSCGLDTTAVGDCGIFKIHLQPTGMGYLSVGIQLYASNGFLRGAYVSLHWARLSWLPRFDTRTYSYNPLFAFSHYWSDFDWIRTGAGRVSVLVLVTAITGDLFPFFNYCHGAARHALR